MGSDISPRVKREQSVGLRGLAPVGCVDQAFLADRNDDGIRAASGTSAVYFCYPVSPGLIPATAYFADAAKRAALKVVVNMSQISAREDSKSHAARDHWIAERLFDWSGVPTVHIRPTFFSEWLLPVCATPCGVDRAHSSTQEMEAMMRQSDNVPGTEKMDYEAWSALLRPLYGSPKAAE